MSRSSVFNRVGKLRPKRNPFDLSYRTNFTCNIGELIPVQFDEVVPGDYLRIGAQVTIRFQPLAAPIMHELSATVHTFFVPYRLLDENWEDFIVGKITENPAGVLPRFSPDLDASKLSFTLWDYFGMPMLETAVSNTSLFAPISYPWYAYNMIYNEFFRDQNLEEAEVPLGSNAVHRRAWKKDYFTAALPWQQRGIPPALPVNIDFGWNNYPPIDGRPPIIPVSLVNNLGEQSIMQVTNTQSGGAALSGNTSITGDSGMAFPGGTQFGIVTNAAGAVIAGAPDPYGLTAEASTFDISQLRLATQIQKWMERNARGGIRYTEFLDSHFGYAPSDARLQRPEYIGGMRMPIIVSEVLQTSQTTVGQGGSPLGDYAGHGLSADGSFIGKYQVREYGIVMSILSVMPKPSYQQGINRQWLREVPTDFYFPEFAHLSEQGIYMAELYASRAANFDNREIFGFIGQYDEMRTKHDIVAGEMRVNVPGGQTLSYWNMSRYFQNKPLLNNSFIKVDDSTTNRPFAVSGVRQLICNVRNSISALRPLPLIAEPGLMDHF